VDEEGGDVVERERELENFWFVGFKFWKNSQTNVKFKVG
jgi:hypothetical protein